MSTTIIDRDLGYDAMIGLLDHLEDVAEVAVTVGVRAKRGRELVKIAAINEFGGIHQDGSGEVAVPERSFLRSTVDENSAKYVAMLERAAELLVAGVDGRRPMAIIGHVVVRDVQLKITGRINPPNAPLTIKRKGSDVPLVDTGRLRASIDHVVEFKR
jgi:hypothetical protein